MTPVYNGADSLSACLDSVRAQNYKNRIHLVADNASTDGSRQIAEGFAAQDPRIHVLSFRELPPMLENFNRALAAIPSSAVYLKQLNVDDTLHPTCLEKDGGGRRARSLGRFRRQSLYLGSVVSPRNAPAQAVRLSRRPVAKETPLGTSNILGTPSVPLMRIHWLVGRQDGLAYGRSHHLRSRDTVVRP